MEAFFLLAIFLQHPHSLGSGGAICNGTKGVYEHRIYITGDRFDFADRGLGEYCFPLGYLYRGNFLIYRVGGIAGWNCFSPAIQITLKPVMIFFQIGLLFS
jgi:hypothetical protein